MPICRARSSPALAHPRDHVKLKSRHALKPVSRTVFPPRGLFPAWAFMDEQQLLQLVAIGGRGADRVATSTAGIGDALPALAADPDIEQLVEIAQRCGDRRKYEQRSWEHSANARAGKALKRAKLEAQAAVAQKKHCRPEPCHIILFEWGGGCRGRDGQKGVTTREQSSGAMFARLPPDLPRIPESLAQASASISNVGPGVAGHPIGMHECRLRRPGVPLGRRKRPDCTG